MSDLIDTALRAAHAAPGHAVPAAYHSSDGADIAEISVTLARPDDLSAPFEGAGARTTKRAVRILAADVPEARERDEITLYPGTAAATRHKIHSPHLPEPHRRRWRATLSEPLP